MVRVRKGVFLLLLAASAAFSGDKVGSVFSGVDYLPNNEYDETSAGVYRLGRAGFAVGFMVPLNFPFADSHLKVKASTHRIGKRAWDWEGKIRKDESALYDRHASALNELLIGKDIATGRNTSILPQLGLGFQLDALDQDGDSPVGGIVYSGLFSDFSGRFRYRFRGFGLEAMANYQFCLLPSWNGYEATDRLAISLGAFR